MMYNHRAFIFGPLPAHNNNVVTPFIIECSYELYLATTAPYKEGNYCDMTSSDTQIILSEELSDNNGELYANIRK